MLDISEVVNVAQQAEKKAKKAFRVGKQILQFPLGLIRRQRMASQRERFFKGDMKASRLASSCERSCSFSNPVYDQAANYDDASAMQKSPVQFMTAYGNNRYEVPKELNDSGLYGSGSSSPSTF
uniref:Uncharacterized protein n=1 Tax=Romanomermis culicivorax TaxID=13658 RepID=A0A915I0H0_ROMCU